MTLPIKAFWFMNAQIERINAQRDIRSLDVISATNSPDIETVTSYRERLVIEIGEVVRESKASSSPMDAVRDEVGFAELRAMASEKIGR